MRRAPATSFPAKDSVAIRHSRTKLRAGWRTMLRRQLLQCAVQQQRIAMQFPLPSTLPTQIGAADAPWFPTRPPQLSSHFVPTSRRWPLVHRLLRAHARPSSPRYSPPVAGVAPVPHTHAIVGDAMKNEDPIAVGLRGTNLPTPQENTIGGPHVKILMMRPDLRKCRISFPNQVGGKLPAQRVQEGRARQPAHAR